MKDLEENAIFAIMGSVYGCLHVNDHGYLTILGKKKGGADDIP
jgi:hypothetical protein